MSQINNPIAVEFLYYNRWANLKLLEACSRLPGELLDSSSPGVYGSIYATLEHIIRSEASYLRTMTGTDLPPPFSWANHPGLAEMRTYAERVGSALVEAARQANMSDAIHYEWQGQSFHYKSITLLIQALNHGVEHRTNITTILAQQGIQPPAIDGWDYMKSNPDRLGA